MDGTQIAALISGIGTALVVRLSKVAAAWLAGVLGVDPPAVPPDEKVGT